MFLQAKTYRLYDLIRFMLRIEHIYINAHTSIIYVLRFTYRKRIQIASFVIDYTFFLLLCTFVNISKFLKRIMVIYLSEKFSFLFLFGSYFKCLPLGVLLYSQKISFAWYIRKNLNNNLKFKQGSIEIYRGFVCMFFFGKSLY